MTRFYEFAAGGGALTFAIKGQWVPAVVLVVVYVVLILSVPQVVRYYTSRTYAGLTLVVPVAPLDPGAKIDQAEARRHMRVGVDSLRQAVRDVIQVELLVASGFRVIGWEGNPGWLHDVLRDRAKVIRLSVLMLDPDCPSAQARAERVLRPHGHTAYRAGTTAVLATLKRWREQLGMDVSVSLYTEPPIWQMVRLPKELWLMYASDDRGSDYSPFYVFRRDTDYSLSWALDAVWVRRMEHESTRAVDWSAVQAPRPSDIAVVEGP